MSNWCVVATNYRWEQITYRNMSEQEARAMAEMLDRQFEVNGVSYYATAQASPSRVPTIWQDDTAAHVRETVDELRRDGAGE